MSEDLVKTLRDISDQAAKGVEAAQSVGDPYQLSASIGRWGELFGQAADELVHLRSQVACLREALDCQAGVTEKGPASSPSALQKSAGEDAEEDPLAMECDAEPLFARADREIAKLDAAAAVASNMRRPRHDNDFGRWAQLIEDMKAWMVERIEIDRPSRPMVGLLSQLTEEQRAALFAYDGPEYLGGDDKRPDEERASAMSAHSGEAGGLTPQETSDV